MGDFFKIILFLLVLVGVAVWLLSSGSALFKSAPAEKITVSQSTKVQNQVNSAPASASPAKTTIEQEIPDSSIPAGFTRAQLSPHFQKIRISSAFGSSFSGYPWQIQISSNLQNSENVNITGWKIKSNSARQIIIPEAVNLYDTSGYSGNSNIVVSSNSYVTMYGNTSAVNRNLRLNKCIGFLENDYDFVPAIPRNCPLPSRSDIQYLSGQCQSYIFSLNSCQLPDVSFYNSLPGNEDGNKCRTYLSKINYNSCVSEHRADLDFFLNDWRVWLSQQNILDSQHDTVNLFDGQGLLVSQYVY